MGFEKIAKNEASKVSPEMIEELEKDLNKKFLEVFLKADKVTTEFEALDATDQETVRQSMLNHLHKYGSTPGRYVIALIRGGVLGYGAGYLAGLDEQSKLLLASLTSVGMGAIAATFENWVRSDVKKFFSK